MTDRNQPKQLKMNHLKTGGIIFSIIDNDGTTVLHEFVEPSERWGIERCQDWLEKTYGVPATERK